MTGQIQGLLNRLGQAEVSCRGLEEKVRDTALHRLDDLLDPGLGAEEKNRDLGMTVAHRREQLGTLGPAEMKLADQDVEVAGAQGTREVGRMLDLVQPGLRQMPRQDRRRESAVLRVLVNQQNPWADLQGAALQQSPPRPLSRG